MNMLSWLIGLCMRCHRAFTFKKIFLLFLFCAIMLGGVFAPHAEIYRWQDHEGIIRYANTPPEDRSLILEVIPTQRIPLIEDADGTLYYLHMPDGNNAGTNSAVPAPKQLMLPTDVVEQIFREAAVHARKEPSEDLTALTIRLTELEQTLQSSMSARRQWEEDTQRMTTYVNNIEKQNEALKLALADMDMRLASVQEQWQQKYQHAQTYTQTLEQQNTTLQRALDDLQTDMTRVHEGMTASSQQIAALQTPQRQLGELKSRVAELQVSVTDISRHSGQKAVLAQQEVEHWQAVQEQSFQTLSARLETLASDVDSLQIFAVPEKFSIFSAKLESLENRLPEISAKVEKATQQQVKKVSQQVAMLDTQLKRQNVSDALTTLSGKINTLETQNAPMRDVQTALTSLTTKIESLETERLPVQHVETTLASLTAKLDALEQQTKQNQPLGSKITSLQSDLDSLRELVPDSHQSTEIVEKLLNNGEILKNLMTYQAEQLAAQREQTNRLQQELRQMKTSLIPGTPQKAPVVAEALNRSAELSGMLKKQGTTLTTQQDRIQQLEALVRQMLRAGSRSSVVRLEDEDVVRFEEPTGGRISIVPRKKRRTIPDFSFISLVSKTFR